MGGQWSTFTSFHRSKDGRDYKLIFHRCSVSSVRQALSQQVLHCTCFAYKHSVNIKFSQFLFCFCLFFFPRRAAVSALSSSQVFQSSSGHLRNNLQSLLSICKQSRMWNSASIVSFFSPLPSLLAFQTPHSLYLQGKQGEERETASENETTKLSQSVFTVFFLFFLNHYRSSTLYFSWKWAS